jgi:hypothetical protein
MVWSQSRPVGRWRMNNQDPVSGSECGFKPGWSLPADANESPAIFSDGVSQDHFAW